MAALSPTQFAAKCIGLADWPPPIPKRGPRYGDDDRCWLCGGPTAGVGWPIKTAFGATFTNVNLARVPTSQTACQACVYLSSGGGWLDYAGRHPDLGLKTAHPLSWRSYSHVFSRAGHACPQRAGWRRLLVDPPEPPFLFCITLTQKKHLLFRSQIAYSPERFPVQFEEDTLYVTAPELERCFVDFERLLNLGCNRESIMTGRYLPAHLKAIPLRVWRDAEAAFRPWRERFPAYVALAGFCAQREEVSDGETA